MLFHHRVPSTKRLCQTSHVTSQPHDVDVLASDEEPDSPLVAGSSVEEMLCAQTEDIEPQQPGGILFSPAQMSVIQETVSSSVREAMLAFHHRDVSPRSIAVPSPSLSNVATPLGLNRPLDKVIKDKIPGCIPCTSHTEDTPRVSKLYAKLPPRRQRQENAAPTSSPVPGKNFHSLGYTPTYNIVNMRQALGMDKFCRQNFEQNK